MVGNLIFVIIALLAFLMGIYVYSQPLKIIDIQRRFYLLINWKIEPVSMQKEIRNTKAMGLFLIIFVIIVCVYIYVK